MKFLGSKFTLPVASVVAILALVGAQAMALSQTPSDEIAVPASDTKLVAEVSADPTSTPIENPDESAVLLPSDDEELDDDANDDEDSYEEDSYDDDSDDAYENESDDLDDDHEDMDEENEDEEGDDD